eukprot:TRINITY_DN792_c1_g3_i2.p1 TRINITY_DN792_c1_g3~~TRINITY_DN792_c1_g3_i2.p1  ORF type:complete len:1141 (+),score=329.02 TRINITY_DN792_c1_g3_i2:133-3555(+)
MSDYEDDFDEVSDRENESPIARKYNSSSKEPMNHGGGTYETETEDEQVSDMENEQDMKADSLRESLQKNVKGIEKQSFDGNKDTGKINSHRETKQTIEPKGTQSQAAKYYGLDDSEEDEDLDDESGDQIRDSIVPQTVAPVAKSPVEDVDVDDAAVHPRDDDYDYDDDEDEDDENEEKKDEIDDVLDDDDSDDDSDVDSGAKVPNKAVISEPKSATKSLEKENSPLALDKSAAKPLAAKTHAAQPEPYSDYDDDDDYSEDEAPKVIAQRPSVEKQTTANAKHTASESEDDEQDKGADVDARYRRSQNSDLHSNQTPTAISGKYIAQSAAAPSDKRAKGSTFMTQVDDTLDEGDHVNKKQQESIKHHPHKESLPPKKPPTHQSKVDAAEDDAYASHSKKGHEMHEFETAAAKPSQHNPYVRGPVQVSPPIHSRPPQPKQPTTSKPSGKNASAQPMRKPSPSEKPYVKSKPTDKKGSNTKPPAAMPLIKKSLKTVELENVIAEKDKVIAQLKEENKTLVSMARRQEKALSNMDHQQADLPRILDAFQADIKVLKEKIKTYQQRLSQSEKACRLQEENSLKLKERCVKLESILHSKNIEERAFDEEDRLRKQIGEKDAIITELEYRLGVIQASKDAEQKKTKQQLKSALHDIDQLRKELMEAQETIKLKEKQYKSASRTERGGNSRPKHRPNHLDGKSSDAKVDQDEQVIEKSNYKHVSGVEENATRSQVQKLTADPKAALIEPQVAFQENQKAPKILSTDMNIANKTESQVLPNRYTDAYAGMQPPGTGLEDGKSETVGQNTLHNSSKTHANRPITPSNHKEIAAVVDDASSNVLLRKSDKNPFKDVTTNPPHKTASSIRDGSRPSTGSVEGSDVPTRQSPLHRLESYDGADDDSQPPSHQSPHKTHKDLPSQSNGDQSGHGGRRSSTSRPSSAQIASNIADTLENPHSFLQHPSQGTQSRPSSSKSQHNTSQHAEKESLVFSSESKTRRKSESSLQNDRHAENAESDLGASQKIEGADDPEPAPLVVDEDQLPQLVNEQNKMADSRRWNQSAGNSGSGPLLQKSPSPLSDSGAVHDSERAADSVMSQRPYENQESNIHPSVSQQNLTSEAPGSANAPVSGDSTAEHTFTKPSFGRAKKKYT